MLKKYLIVLSLLLSSMLVPGLSNAACALTGTVVQVLSYDDSYATSSGVIYFRTDPLAPYVYYTYTNDDDMISNAIAYMDGGRTVTIEGNAATCPAITVGGFGHIGALTYMW